MIGITTDLISRQANEVLLESERSQHNRESVKQSIYLRKTILFLNFIARSVLAACFSVHFTKL